jgi:cation transport ATPase
MESALHSIGQIAVTLAGFAALLRAFRERTVADPHSDPRLISIVEQGLAVAFLCFLPALLIEFGLTMETAARWGAALAAVWLTRWLYILYTIRKAELGKSLARLFRVAVAMHVAAYTAFLLSAIGLLGRAEPLYFSGVFLMVTEVGWSFLAQFLSERSQPQ